MTTKRMQPPAMPRSRQNRSGPPPGSFRRHRRPAIDRFLLTYLYRELRSRLRQALLIALGLGLGVGLVVTVAAVSAGVGNAQGAVLHSLYGIGTDLTVASPTSSGGANNRSGDRGGAIPNAIQPGSLGLLPSTWVTRISRLAHVASAAGGLELTELTQSGGVPQSLSVDGIDVTHPGLGPLASGTLTPGHDFSKTDGFSNVAVLDANYAATNKLSVGSTITLDGTRIHVIGITSQAEGGGADIYLPLGRAQALARSSVGKSLTGQVNEIYVAAASSADVGAVQTQITRLFPSVTVTSASSLASQVSGSLASTTRLTNDLGKWVAVAALVAAFAVAGLLTAAAVNRRVRELGTLKALGWSTRRIVTQIMGESAVVGVLGALIGIAIGFAGSAFVDAVAPTLAATVPQGVGSGESTTVPVYLIADITEVAVIVAVLLAIAGALVAGAVGAWRASKLQPADAFAQIG
jgi:putative ABC transport system permease protein